MASQLRVDSIESSVGSSVGIGTTGGTVTINGSVNISGGSVANVALTPSSLSINGNAYPSAGPLSNRNIIINGDMRIAQRGTAAVTTSGAFPVDRWTNGFVTAGAISAQQSTAVTPDNFGYSIACTVTTADATTGSTDFWNIQQIIEGFDAARLLFGTANAQSVTVSFWVRGSVTGTYCVTLLGSSDGTNLDRSYVSEYTIASADTWEYKTITVPGDTSGTWTTNNGRGLVVRFGLTAGSNFQQAAGSWGTTNAVGSSNQTQLLETLNATWYVAGVQLEVGTVATPFEHRSYGQELALCQRYYQVTGISSTGGPPTNAYGGYIGATYPNNATSYGTARFHTPMRAIPNVVLYDNTGASATATQNGTANGISASASHITPYGFTVVQKTTGVWTDDARYTIYAGYTANAEL